MHLPAGWSTRLEKWCLFCLTAMMALSWRFDSVPGQTDWGKKKKRKGKNPRSPTHGCGVGKARDAVIRESSWSFVSGEITAPTGTDR